MTKKNGEKSCFIRKKCVIFAKNKLFIKTMAYKIIFISLNNCKSN